MKKFREYMKMTILETVALAIAFGFIWSICSNLYSIFSIVDGVDCTVMESFSNTKMVVMFGYPAFWIGIQILIISEVYERS